MLLEIRHYTMRYDSPHQMAMQLVHSSKASQRYGNQQNYINPSLSLSRNQRH